MSVTLFNNLGAVYYDLVPVGQTANFASYTEILSVWGVPFSRNGQKSNETVGSCTMTMCLITSPLQYGNL